jgi:hypothetical protein
MATTTPNYGWPVPTSTDFVKDGAQAIEDLGDAIDATVYALGSGALTLISATTIGTAVSSVAVTSAFSATYDAYKITVTGGVASTNNDITMILGATNTGYFTAYSGVNYSGSGSNLYGASNAVNFPIVGVGGANGLDLNLEIGNPFLAKRTYIHSRRMGDNTGFFGGGYVNNTTSYTDFTLGASSGNFTGGIIRVYGYQN